MAKIFGQLEKAQLENTTSDTGSLPKGMVTYRTDQNVAKVSDGTVMKTLVDTDSTQTLSGKTLTNPIVNSGTLNTPTIDVISATEQGSTPTSPSAGTRKLYVKTDGKAYLLNSSGTETPLGSGGAGGINYILNGDAEVNTTGWTTYADAAGAVPVDGTGGSPTVTWTRSTSTPLRGAASFLFTKPASNVQGQGVSDDFTIDLADRGKILTLTADINLVSGTYNEGTQTTPSDLTAYIYDVTNAVLLPQPAEYRILPGAVGVGGKLQLTFQTNTNSSSYRLIFHSATTSTAAYVLQMDNIVLGPQILTRGALVTDWADFTPSGVWTTNSTYTGKFRRVGGNLEVYGRVALAGAPNAGTFTFNLPSGLSIDTTRITSSGSLVQNLGTARSVTTGSVNYVGSVIFNSATSVAVVSSGAANVWSNTTPGTWANGDYAQLEFSVPILGWSSSQILSSDAGTRAVTASYSRSGGSVTVDPSSTVLPMTTLGIDTHAAYNTTTGAYTVPESGDYLISLQAAFSAVASGGYVAFRVYSGSVPADGGASALVDFYNYNRAATAQEATVFGSKVIRLTAGQVIFFVPQTNSTGVSLNASLRWNSFSITKIQGPQQIAATEAIVARATKSAGMALSTTPTIIDFNTKVFDSHNAVTTGAGWRFTAPSAGYYRVTAQYSVGSTAIIVYYLAIYKNGVAYSETGVTRQSSNAAIEAPQINDLVFLAAGEYIDLRATLNTGTATMDTAPVYNYVSVQRIGV